MNPQIMNPEIGDETSDDKVRASIRAHMETVDKLDLWSLRSEDVDAAQSDGCGGGGDDDSGDDSSGATDVAEAPPSNPGGENG
jgi:hypothetical protein